MSDVEDVGQVSRQLTASAAELNQCRDDLLKARQQALTSENLGSELQREKDLMAQELLECKEELGRCIEQMPAGPDDKGEKEQMARELSE